MTFAKGLALAYGKIVLLAIAIMVVIACVVYVIERRGRRKDGE